MIKGVARKIDRANARPRSYMERISYAWEEVFNNQIRIPLELQSSISEKQMIKGVARKARNRDGGNARPCSYMERISSAWEEVFHNQIRTPLELQSSISEKQMIKGVARKARNRDGGNARPCSYMERISSAWEEVFHNQIRIPLELWATLPY